AASRLIEIHVSASSRPLAAKGRRISSRQDDADTTAIQVHTQFDESTATGGGALSTSHQSRRTRFWVEIGIAGAAAALAVLTSAWPDWSETIFRVNPDAGSGALEWGIVGLLCLIFLTLSVAAGIEMRSSATTT